jgi:hypothetical protein
LRFGFAQFLDDAASDYRKEAPDACTACAGALIASCE